MKADRGSGSIWMLAMAALVTVAAVFAVALAGAVTVRHRAAAAADLAALAAAGTAAVGGHTCAAATRVAGANGARLTKCHVDGLVVDVTTTVTPTGWVSRFGVSSVRSARAGPIVATETCCGDSTGDPEDLLRSSVTKSSGSRGLLSSG